MALSTDLPDDAAAHVEVGQLFATAGDSGHALDQFQRALRLAPRSGAALAGAGQAAFQLGDYLLARTYLRQRAGRARTSVKNTGNSSTWCCPTTRWPTASVRPRDADDWLTTSRMPSSA